MAITNVRAIQRIETYPAQDSSAADTTNEGNPTMMVVYEHTFDDSSDDALPVTSTIVKNLQRYVVTVDDEGNETSATTNVSGEDQMVQDICAAMWVSSE